MDRLYVSEGDHYAQHARKNRYPYETFSILFRGWNNVRKHTCMVSGVCL
jgi:hypothetical protein